MKIEPVHVFSLNALGFVWCVWFWVWVFLVFSLGFFVLVWIFVVVVCLFPVFLNEEFFLSAEQLLKQWIMIYFCGI